MGTSLVLLAGFIGLSWRGLTYVNQELAPAVARDLSQSLNRPVKLGPVQSFTLASIQFGPSEIPAYRHTINGSVIQDSDSATTDAVNVRFDLWEALWTRTLDLDVQLVRPHLYLEQTQDGQWLDTTLNLKDSEQWFKTQLETLRFTEGRAQLVPYRSALRQVDNLIGQVTFTDQNQRVPFDAEGEIKGGGRATLQGEWLVTNQTLSLEAQTNQLAIPALAGLIPDLPVQIKSGQLAGTVKLQTHPRKPWEITSTGRISGLDLTWPQESIRGRARRLTGQVQVQYQSDQDPKLSGQFRVENGQVWVPEDLILVNGRSRRQRWQGVNGTLKFLPKTQQVQVDLKGQLAAGGRLRVKGKAALGLDQAQVALQLRKIPAQLLDQAYQLPLRVRAGRVDANLKLRLRQDQEPYLLGTARITQGEGEIMGVPQPFRQINGRLRFRGLTTTLETVRAVYGQIPLQAQGGIDPDRGYALTAKSAVVEVNKALETLEITALPFPVAGQVQAPQLQVTGDIERPVLSGIVATQGTPTLDRVPFQQMQATFQLKEPLLNITDIEARPVGGGMIAGNAQLDVRSGGELVATLQARNISGDAITRLYQAQSGFDIGPVAAGINLYGPSGQINTDVTFHALQSAYPTTGKVLLRSETVYLREIVARIPGGNLQIAGQIEGDRVQAIATLPGLELSQIDPALQGVLTGQLSLTGPVSSFSSETVRAQGNLRFSQGISLVQQPITAQVRWNGRHIQVPQATAPGFVAAGIVGARLEGPQSPELTTLDLSLQAQDYPLATLPELGTEPVALQGRADLKGRLTGTVAAPRLTATVTAKQLAVTRLGFESPLNGRLDYGPTDGLDLQLMGDRDRIELALTPELEPTAFTVRQSQAIATGRTKGNQLLVNVTQFPLLALGLRPAANVGLGPLSGTASGNFVINWGDRRLDGTVTVTEPGIGNLVGDQFNAQVHYEGGVAKLDQGQLIHQDNQLRLTAQLNPGENPQFSGQIQVDRAQIEDVIAALPSLQLNGHQEQAPPIYGKAADVETIPVGDLQAPLGDQLQLFTAIEQQIALQAPPPKQQTPWPDLAEVRGPFRGNIQFAGTQQGGLEGSFELLSDPLTWNQATIDQVVATGSWRDNTLTLAPLSIAAGEGLIHFTGQLGEKKQLGQLQLTQLPLQRLQQLSQLPFTISGQLGGEATLAGSLTNPQFQGEFKVTAATLNETAVNTARAHLTYTNARLDFKGRAVLDTPDPILFEGKIPYAFPFASVKPETDQLMAKLKVKNQGLSLLNLFTEQLAWVDGQGELQLEARGTLDQPLLDGNLSFANATFNTPLLTQSLQNVMGNITFDRNRLTVTQLTGDYQQGQISALGSLPIVKPQNNAPLTSPALTVALTNLNLNFQDLYRGQIAGEIQITGSLLEPELGGSVQLEKGQVLLAKATSAPANPQLATESTELLPPVRFKDLKVQLGESVSVTQAPLLNFVASGDILVNGELDDLRPQGTIRFRQGTINLFTTVFRVDPNQENYAQFQPEFGVDPYLNVGLVASVTEVNQDQLAGINDFNPVEEVIEVNEFTRLPTGTLGLLESIRVRATVDGLASQLTENFDRVVELSSDPDRSRRRILTLLGGGAAESLRAGNTRAALFSLASSAVLTNFESAVDNLLGGRVSVRAFPAVISITEAGEGNQAERTRSVVEFGTELGFDVTKQFSVSVLQILTGPDRPTRFNVSYDINDNFRARSAIDTDGDAVGVLEYRLRF